MLAVEQEFDELEMAVKNFQNTTMRLRYSSILIVAPHGLTLGGGWEICLHADKELPMLNPKWDLSSLELTNSRWRWN